jgi:hypothetical protein
MNQMQSELGRILEPGGLEVAWRPIHDPSAAGDFRDIFVMRFRGYCGAGRKTKPVDSDAALAETSVSGG